ncbi:MAG: hypothetical protein KBG82_00670 [Spirochaetes bacterium]|nr:hypothetical protein [Spirochaetota bacterium]HOV45533.1 TrmH family RNA methyltransferase [Exilispira sp.]MBP8990473.1 hypothetical protein [Spirochaetota bacterium]HPB48396.1 TrmH family RNA methyltransferase [Exilispira sp.]HPO60079.1 TrmH family RNA methyltransferase [Exilispira sp.]
MEKIYNDENYFKLSRKNQIKKILSLLDNLLLDLKISHLTINRYFQLNENCNKNEIDCERKHKEIYLNTIEKNLMKLIFYTQKYKNYFDYIEKIKRLIFTDYLIKTEGSKLTIESKSYMQSWNILIEKNREELYQILISLRQAIILNENMSNFESDFTNYISYDETHGVKSRLNLSVILDNIRSPFNAGSIIRSAESFCFEKVIMTGITTMIPENKIFRSSMGAENFIEILKFNNIKDCINYLRNENYTIYVLEKKKDSISLWDSTFEDKIALVVGNEEFGVDDDFISDADFCISIPQNGVKNSLNVSSAFAIAASWIYKSNAQIL